MVLVVDGVEKPKQDIYGYPVYSPDSKSFAYAYASNGKYCLNVNGKDNSADFDVIFKFFFSPDSSHYAYIAAKNKLWYVVYDNKKSDGYKKIASFKFSPDSTRFAYSAVTNKNLGTVIIDEKPQKEYPTVGEAYFSPDSKHVVYKAVNKEKNLWATVIDGKMQNR